MRPPKFPTWNAHLAYAMRRRKPYDYEFGAAFCIYGLGPRHADISAKTGLKASQEHRTGDVRRPGGTPWSNDAWILNSPLGRPASLSAHAAWLWKRVSPHQRYFKRILKEAEAALLSFGCRTENWWPMLEVDARSLAMVHELGLSIAFNMTIFREGTLRPKKRG
jgi:hypothetical protein